MLCFTSLETKLDINVGIDDTVVVMFLLKLPLLVDLQQKVGELVLSIIFCPPIIILEND
jgi:hypothetical protein